MNIWDPLVSFESLNSRFQGYDYINLQLTRVHADLLKQEIESFCRTGLLPKVKSSYNETLGQHNPTDQARSPTSHSTNNDDFSGYLNPRRRESLPKLSGRQRFNLRSPTLLEVPITDDVPVFLSRIKELQLRRREWEKKHWREPEDISSISAKPMTASKGQKSQQVLANNDENTVPADEHTQDKVNSGKTSSLLPPLPPHSHGFSGDSSRMPPKIGRYTLEEYKRLFTAGFKAHKRLIFRYDSGDAKAVRYIPTCLKSLFQ